MRAKIASHLWKTLGPEIQAYFRHRHDEIKVKPGTGLFNYKCFYNAAQSALDAQEKKLRVIECVYFSNHYAILHYINQDVETGEYIDNTLGHLASDLQYYFLREIPPQTLTDMDILFGKAQDYWDSVFLKWYHRLAGITRAL